MLNPERTLRYLNEQVAIFEERLEVLEEILKFKRSELLQETQCKVGIDYVNLTIERDYVKFLIQGKLWQTVKLDEEIDNMESELQFARNFLSL